MSALITVYLNLSESRTFPQRHSGWLRDAVHHWLKEFGPCEVVLDRPDAWPGSYVEVRYGPTLEHMRRRMGQRIASLCTTRLLDGVFLGEWYSHVIWHDEEFVRLRPELGQPYHQLVEDITLATVHEFGHALGWAVLEDGRHWPKEQTPEWWALCKSNHSIAIANLSRYRRADQREALTG